MIQAGKLRHRVLFQQPTTRPGQFNEPVPTGTAAAVLTCWAAIETLTGRELWLARQVRADVTHRIRMRYRSGLEPRMEAVYQGRVFELLEVLDPDERRIELEILAKERVD